MAQHHDSFEEGAKELEEMAKKVEENFREKRNLKFWEKFYNVQQAKHTLLQQHSQFQRIKDDLL